MIRFGLLQFRAQALVALAVLAAVAVTLLVTGAHLTYLYDSSGLAGCAPHGDCAALTSALLARVRGYGAFPVIYWGGIYVLYLVPAVIGTFWGAPLITREIEAGTLRLAWTQGVTRARWLAVKLGLAGLASVAAAGLLSLMVTWWAGPVDGLDPYGMNRLQPAMFGTRGIVPAGYAVFAFVLGVTAGLLIRNTVGAMAATPAIMVAVEGAVIAWVRLNLIAPVRVASPLNLAAVQAAGATAPAGRLGVLQPGAQRERPHLPGARAPGLRVEYLAGMPERAGQAAPAAGGDVPARRPVLAAAVGRDLALPGPGAAAGRVLLLVDPPPLAWIAA